jgi:hypothetical protein
MEESSMRRVSRLSSSLIVSLLAVSSWAAKPGPAPDTQGPAAITDLVVMEAVRSLTLRFTATGDDGTSGTAYRYDVRYAAMESCPGSPGDEWTEAARSDLQKPIAAGNADAFVVRPLAAGTAYCLAIRVLDEAWNPSAWSLVRVLLSGVAQLRAPAG